MAVALKLNVYWTYKKIIFITKKRFMLENFITLFCVGCSFGKLISNNKLRFSKAYLHPAVLSANLHLKMAYTTDGANVCTDFTDVIVISKHLIICPEFAYEFIGLVSLFIVQKVLSHNVWVFCC